jgi:hypothetical protein
MNRIILIGNGFDLAHGLETSYRNFIDNFWYKMAVDFNNTHINANTAYVNDNFTIHSDYRYSGIFPNYKEFKDRLQGTSGRIVFKNQFLEIISENLSFKKWIDIEEEYYQQLKKIVQKAPQFSKNSEISVKKLNDNFEIIKQELEKYLSEIVSKDIPETKNMHYIFCDNFKLQDFPSSRENLLLEYLYNILENSTNEYYKKIQYEFRKYYESIYGVTLTTQITKKDVVNLFKVQSYRKRELLERIYPENTLVLNFNYTKTESLYSNNSKNNKPTNFQSINIHGELESDINPIIFGYGDELADEYKELEKLQDKEYFKNIKSINYLKTNNYRHLLNFADSNYFQIYTLGHSCGNSDRTLLNTLFEHDNCVSIKPFFYENNEKDGTKTSDYEEIVINISRNFTDKKKLRERVVNKTFCEALPQIKKEL